MGFNYEFVEDKEFLARVQKSCNDDMKEIEMYIEDIRSAAKEDERIAITEAKSRLKLHIYQLRRLSVFSMESVF